MVDLNKVGKGLIAMGAVLSDLKVIYDADSGDISFGSTSETEITEVETTEETPKEEPKAKKKRKRRTKAEMQAAKEAEVVETKEEKEEITGDMFDEPAPKADLPAIDEATLRSKMVEHAKKFDKEKTFSILGKFDGATGIAQLSADQRAECYAMIEADINA